MQEENGSSTPSNDELLRMTSEIVTSFVSNNAVSAESLPDVIRSVYRTVSSLAGSPEARADEKLKPAVPVSKSVGTDYIICLEDGRKLKMLKRYLRSRYDMSPDEYRRRWACRRIIRWSRQPILSAGRNLPRRSGSARACAKHAEDLAGGLFRKQAAPGASRAVKWSARLSAARQAMRPPLPPVPPDPSGLGSACRFRRT